MAVESHRGFKTQRIARSEAAGQDTFGCAVIASIQNLVPQLLGAVSGGIDFKAVLARVARARDDGGHIINRAFAEMVILNLVERRLCQRLQDAERVRPLYGNLAIIRAHVLQLNILVPLMRLDPVPILLCCRSIDDEQ